MFYILKKYILREKINDKKEVNNEINIVWSLNLISLIICSIILNSISSYDIGYKDIFNNLEINITIILQLMLVETIFFTNILFSSNSSNYYHYNYIILSIHFKISSIRN